MSKAVLVIDMPQNCRNCDFCNMNVHLKKVCRAKVEDSNVCGLYYHEIGNDMNKPDWCPLRPVLEKKKEKYMLQRKDCFGILETYGEKMDRIAVGYNRCIDDILGGTE